MTTWNQLDEACKPLTRALEHYGPNRSQGFRHVVLAEVGGGDVGEIHCDGTVEEAQALAAQLCRAYNAFVVTEPEPTVEGDALYTTIRHSILLYNRWIGHPLDDRTVDCMARQVWGNVRPLLEPVTEAEQERAA